MKCNSCKAREATVHLTEVINGQVSKMHLCDQCAKAKSEEMHSHFGLTDLLSGLMDIGPQVEGGELESGSDVECPMCGMTYFDFQKTGRLGCGKCYDEFSENLNELFRKIHGSDRHVGKTPAATGEEKRQDVEDLNRMRRELNQYIQTEEFERAALLRDKIRDAEKKINGEASL